MAPGVSSKDWVEGVVSQVGLASWGVSVTSSRTGVELLGGLATVGAGWHSASDCQAALSRMQERGARSSELAWRFAAEYAKRAWAWPWSQALRPLVPCQSLQG